MSENHVIGTGIDLVELERIARALEQWGDRFRNRVFLPAEQSYCEQASQPVSRYAARFAVKEAVAKALTTGIGRQLSWLDIAVGHDAAGAPTVELSARARELADRRGIARFQVSISHTRQQAVALALALGPCP